MKRLYIASPFFNEAQLLLVKFAELSIEVTEGLTHYSPRFDGVLKDMTAAERKAAGPKLFKLNCQMIRECDAVLALKDYSDTGTTWETGFAYGIGKPVFGYRSNPSQPLNIMVLQCMQAAIYGPLQLKNFLSEYARDRDLAQWAPETTPEQDAY